ncbi:hypothetical protein COCNU_contig68802202G000010 [Cocos nucifera]|nr:hypothetical protein [Cocos nucifera]
MLPVQQSTCVLREYVTLNEQLVISASDIKKAVRGYIEIAALDCCRYLACIG